MPPAAKDEPADDDDDLPTSDDDDVEAVKPSATAKLPIKPGKADVSEGVTQPLLSDGEGGKPTPSHVPDAAGSKPTTPREKFREMSRGSKPTTPRGDTPAKPGVSVPPLDAAALEAAAKAAAEDPKAAASAAVSALAAADPAAAKAIELAKAAAADPAAAAASVAESIKNIKPPSKEELAAAAAKSKEEALKAAEAGKAFIADMIADAPPAITKLPEAKRMEKYIDMLSEQAEGKAPPGVMKAVKPCLMYSIRGCMALQPWISYIFRWLARIYAMLPVNIVQMLFGAALCYFGGTYSASIAAVEAFRTMGYERAKADVIAVMEEVSSVADANNADDLLDEDGDGTADVDQITPPELLRRKLFLIMKTVQKPERIQSAVASVWAAILAVLATLRLEFAATTAMALGIVEMVKFPFIRMVSPTLLKLFGPHLKHWITMLMESLLSIIAISIAWYAQTMISAFYTAMRGGKLFAEAFFNILKDRAKAGMVVCPGIVGPDFDPNESVLDEVVGFIIASQGLMFQVVLFLDLTSNRLFCSKSYLFWCSWFVRFLAVFKTSSHLLMCAYEMHSDIQNGLAPSNSVQSDILPHERAI